MIARMSEALLGERDHRASWHLMGIKLNAGGSDLTQRRQGAKNRKLLSLRDQGAPTIRGEAHTASFLASLRLGVRLISSAHARAPRKITERRSSTLRNNQTLRWTRITAELASSPWQR